MRVYKSSTGASFCRIAILLVASRSAINVGAQGLQLISYNITRFEEKTCR
jgi:hypothetical protein